MIFKKISLWRKNRRRRRRFEAMVSRLAAQGNELVMSELDFPRVYIEVVGTGNSIRLGKLYGNGLLTIRVSASASKVEIGEGLHISGALELVIGGVHPECGPVRNSSIAIGANTGIESARIATYTSNSHIVIGEGCMIAYDVNLYHSDAHPIYDLVSGQLVNHVGTMYVGDHVWIGAKSTILKNAVIPDGCIVGFGSVVSGRYSERNVAIAGNPARIVTKDGRRVRWEVADPAYIANLGS